MRRYFIVAVFCISISFPLQAQEVVTTDTGIPVINPVADAAAPQPEVVSVPAVLNPQEIKTTVVPLAPNTDDSAPRSAMSVARLPDIKLNESLITKSVLDYKTDPLLSQAQIYYAAADTDKAIEAYKQLAEDTVNTQAAAQAAADLALIYMQKNSHKEALKYIDKALELEHTSPLYQLIKVWIFATHGDVKKAKKNYDTLLFLTADFEYISSAKLAIVTGEFLKKDYKSAMHSLQNLYGTNPYSISYVAYLMGRINFATKAYWDAQTLFEQSLSHDSNNYMAQKYLANTEEKLKHFVAAWQGYASLFIIDNKNAELGKKLKKLGKNLKADPINYLFYTKLSEVYTKPAARESRSLPIRVGLYTKLDGSITPVKSFTFLPAAAFTIVEEKMGEVLTGEAYTPKTIMWNDEHKGIHIQNKWNTVEFSTKRPFVIKLSRPAAMQVRDIEADNVYASNLGDKELKGTLLVVPSENGMYLINNTKLDDVLPALVTSVARGIREPAVLEALAVALRTRLMKEIYNSQNSLFDLPDYSKYIQYGGVNMQSSYVGKAVEVTTDHVLVEPKAFIEEEEEVKTELDLASPQIYRACSTVTEDGIGNTQTSVDYTFSPINLFQFMISNPPKDLYSAPEDPTLWSSVKWIYTIPVKEIESRLKNYYDIGSLKDITVTSYTPYGRIQKMSFAGSKKSVELDFEEANFILAAGTLRSNFFFMIPLSKGGKPVEYMFLGTDTGNGEGLCINGADGMAREHGKNMQEILRYYYPAFKISTEWKKSTLPLL